MRIHDKGGLRGCNADVQFEVFLFPHRPQSANECDAISQIVLELTEDAVGIRFQSGSGPHVNRNAAEYISKRTLGALETVVRLGVNIEVENACNPARAVRFAAQTQLLRKAGGIHRGIVSELVYRSGIDVDK